MKTCPNCTHPNDLSAGYCQACGQEFRSSRPSLRQLLIEVFQDVFSLDNRFFRTAAALQVPGKLTNLYFRGRRRSYFSPFRVFLLSTLFFVTVTSFLAQEELETQVRETTISLQEDGFRQLLVDEMRERHDTLQTNFSLPEPALEYVDTLLYETAQAGSDSLNISILSFDTENSGGNSSVRFAYSDLVTMSIGDLLDKYEVTGFWNRFFMYQTIKISTQASGLVGYFFGKLIWLILVMVVVSAFILKLLYIRRKRYLVEHLVFSFHSHAVLFLWSTVFILIVFWNAKVGGIVAAVLYTGYVVYLLIAMRQVYRQTWIKTFVKMNVLFFIYSIVSIFAFTIITLLSMALY